MKQQLNRFFLILLVSISFVMLVDCGGDSKSDESKTVSKSNTSGLSDWEFENGFGPIKKKLYLMPVDKSMAAEGEKIFESKCAACHKLDERYVGPAQRDVLQRVTPEFFMNTVLNPDENLQKHPHSKEMLAKYMTKMTNQNIDLEGARKLLEYFRLLDSEIKTNDKPSK